MSDKVYIYEAIRRTKENPTMGKKVFREIAEPGTEQEAIEALRAKCQLYQGTWRIYRTVNARDRRLAEVCLAKMMPDRLVKPDSYVASLEDLWESTLCRPENRAEDYWLLDVDSVDAETINQLLGEFPDIPLNFHEGVVTPNGWHFVVPAGSVDTRRLPEGVSLLRDGLLFVERFDAPTEKLQK